MPDPWGLRAFIPQVIAMSESSVTFTVAAGAVLVDLYLQHRKRVDQDAVKRSGAESWSEFEVRLGELLQHDGGRRFRSGVSKAYFDRYLTMVRDGRQYDAQLSTPDLDHGWVSNRILYYKDDNQTGSQLREILTLPDDKRRRFEICDRLQKTDLVVRDRPDLYHLRFNLKREEPVQLNAEQIAKLVPISCREKRTLSFCFVEQGFRLDFTMARAVKINEAEAKSKSKRNNTKGKRKRDVDPTPDAWLEDPSVTYEIEMEASPGSRPDPERLFLQAVQLLGVDPATVVEKLQPML
jgi:hypothetical protein